MRMLSPSTICESNAMGMGMGSCRGVLCLPVNGWTSKKSATVALFCRVGAGGQRDGPPALATSPTAMADDWLPWLEHVPGRDSSSVINAPWRDQPGGAQGSADMYPYTAPAPAPAAAADADVDADADQGGSARK